MTWRNYVSMMRPLNSFMTGLAVIFSLFVFYRGFPHPIIILIGFITGFMGSAASMLINDYVDRKVDSINKPWKPIPSGKADPVKTKYLSLITLVTGIVINVFLGIGPLVIAFIYSTVGYFYSFLRRYWWSHCIVAFSTTGPIIYGFVLAGMPGDKLLFALLFSTTIFFVTLGREILKAIMDIEGDRRYGYVTLPIRFGVDAARRAMLLIGSVGSAIGVSTGLLGFAGPGYLLFMSIAAVLYMYALIRAYRMTGSIGVLEKSRRQSIIAMLIGLIAFFASIF